VAAWPTDREELIALQFELAAAADEVEPWPLPDRLDELLIAAAFVTFPTGLHGPGDIGDPAWAAAVATRVAEPGVGLEQAVVRGFAGAPYEAGLLALREGALLEAAVGGLEQRPDLLLVDATGRDHPRRAGLALHLGAILDVPTVGVTNRLLCAGPDHASELGQETGACTPLLRHDGRDAPGCTPLGGRAAVSMLAESGAAWPEIVGYAVRVKSGSNPLFAHAAWRTSPETARALVLATSTSRARTPAPLRVARTLARVERARDEGRLPGPGWRWP